jgi:hypothetical protein
MKKSILLSVLIIMGVLAKANDLIVEENGVSPSYDSITAAVRAANSGDRIFIKNKAGNLPWVENITITKSLSLLSYTADSFFIVQGTYNITPATPDTVTIIGMINLVGTIQATTTAPGGARSVIRVLNTQLNSGGIYCPYSNYDLTVEGCYLTLGAISYEHGSILGNTINTGGNAYGIQVASETTATTDTSYIIGNRVYSGYASGYGIYWLSTTMLFNISNNYLTAPYYGIYVGASSGNNTILQRIYNNSVELVSMANNGDYCIYVAGSTGSQIDVQNNAVTKSGSTGANWYGIEGVAANGGGLSCTYNYASNTLSSPIGGTYTVNLDNNTSNAITFSGYGVPSAGVNLGNPGPQFYNTDLSINTVGCFGGSFTQNNFFPSFPSSPSTWLTNYQFNIRTGNTLNIKAYSFSR